MKLKWAISILCIVLIGIDILTMVLTQLGLFLPSPKSVAVTSYSSDSLALAIVFYLVNRKRDNPNTAIQVSEGKNET